MCQTIDITYTTVLLLVSKGGCFFTVLFTKSFPLTPRVLCMVFLIHNRCKGFHIWLDNRNSWDGAVYGRWSSWRCIVGSTCAGFLSNPIHWAREGSWLAQGVYHRYVHLSRLPYECDVSVHHSQEAYFQRTFLCRWTCTNVMNPHLGIRHWAKTSELHICLSQGVFLQYHQ